MTGENKKQFEEWYCSLQFPNTRLMDLSMYEFYNYLPFEMQIGVYLAFIREIHGIYIHVTYTPQTGNYTAYVHDVVDDKDHEEGDLPYKLGTITVIVANSYNDALIGALKEVDYDANRG